ncbi:hypothetical protein XAC2852_450045 [Xanthomonas citri pv. citri]|nr:hypothetical protein XAC3824_470030 [Xanthomonas citri pv. citri]CEE60363.1 hypothetical protein XAC71A_520030 [Xanthomonas citri pv. citri]CEE69965.1 hypothetical protein XAC2852_450045 [Xanthomonas citri pv. citri]CEE77338.1 hypothetical protein XAC3608_900020 [Xanthomonas citri pv. citri]CEE79267.1 hypothetical protein XACLC80_480018 [Xanthomonas citri pv. citri]
MSGERAGSEVAEHQAATALYPGRTRQGDEDGRPARDRSAPQAKAQGHHRHRHGGNAREHHQRAAFPGIPDPQGPRRTGIGHGDDAYRRRSRGHRGPGHHGDLGAGPGHDRSAPDGTGVLRREAGRLGHAAGAAASRHHPRDTQSRGPALPAVRRGDAPAHWQERAVLVLQPLPGLQGNGPGRTRASGPGRAEAIQEPRRSRATLAPPSGVLTPVSRFKLSRTHPGCGTPSPTREVPQHAQPSAKRAPRPGEAPPEGRRTPRQRPRHGAHLIACFRRRRVSRRLAPSGPPGDPPGRRQSLPAPTGETTGSLCARMRARDVSAPATTRAG